MPVNPEYENAVERFAKMVSESGPYKEPEEDPFAEFRRPSTGKPEDYIYEEDLTHLNKGFRLEFLTKTMPLEAADHFHYWLHGLKHKSLRRERPRHAREFKKIMGFTPQVLYNLGKRKGK